MTRFKSAEDFLKFQEELEKKRDPNRPYITVCGGTGCLANGSQKVIDRFIEEIEKRKLNVKLKVGVRVTGCHGFCERGPLVVIRPQDYFYQHVRPEDVPEILDETIVNGKVVERLLYENPDDHEKVLHEQEVPFYAKQTRLIFGMNGYIEPTSIDDYIAIGGYKALAKALTSMGQEEIIEEVKKSKLRGRGGGGFPTGRKWEATFKAEGEPKYVICNADEGDPGAYMDRSLLEGNPHSVIEGMIIGAFAMGSNHGYIYVRNEYPLAVKNAGIAVEKAREYGLLGKNILGSGFDFDIKINRGGGAFVCGESSALFASIEGRPGEPREKYIHATDRGLFDKPTCLNNVETWANVPLIINKGSDWYAQIGTEESKGTKIFSLVGKINNTGLVEVPMGITLREIIYDIGGGIPDGREFKAVQTGGPSGGCIPKEHLDSPVDFDELTKLGSMMGSGGMIIMDDHTCMVDVAKYFTTFLEGESCGKCTPCRDGIPQMRKILEKITEGKGTEEDLDRLEWIAHAIADGSLCALGKTAPNPVLTTLRYFRDEYLAHIRDKKCPAKVCKSLIEYRVVEENCNGCHACFTVCPSDAITGKPKEIHKIDPSKCIRCGACHDVCRFNAIEII